jgi:endothelin-converting enzyme
VLRLTRSQASAIVRKIGYPTTPNVSDAEALARYYSINAPFDQHDYFGNILRSREADVERMWSQVGKERDPGAWEMVPSEVNAYYNRSLSTFTLYRCPEICD